MTERILLNDTDELRPGDHIEITFKFVGPDWTLWRATLAAIFEQKAKSNPNFNITSTRVDGDKYILGIDIIRPKTETQPQLQQASVVSAAVIISACLAMIGGIGWLLLVKVEKIQSTPAGKALSFGLGGIGIAILLVAIVWFWGKLSHAR